MSILVLVSCTNNKKEPPGPYDAILHQQPFAVLTDSIDKDPKNDELWFRRAVMLNKNNFPEPALADFRKAWSLTKDERYALGVSTILLDKKPDSAIVFLENTVREFPASLLLQLSLARAYDASSQTEKAVAVCDQILQKDPNQADALKLKADLLSKTNRESEAISVLEKAYSITPYDIDLNYFLAYLYAGNNNAKVIALCDSLIRVDTLNSHAEPYYYKGIYYSNINDKAKALQLFDKAIERNYQYLNAYIEKGSVLYDQKKFAEALKTFSLVNSISPKFPDSWFWLARTQEALGDREEARMNYLRAYGLDQSFTEAKEAADRLGK